MSWAKLAPYELTRFYSMRDERTVKQAIAVSIGFQLIIGLSVLTIGMLTRVIFPHLASQDQASAVMAFEVLPPLVGALLLVARISIAVSGRIPNTSSAISPLAWN